VAARTFAFKFTGDSKSVEKATKAAGADLDQFGRTSSKVMDGLASDSASAFAKMSRDSSSSFSEMGSDGKRTFDGLEADAADGFGGMVDEAERGTSRTGSVVRGLSGVITAATAAAAAAAVALGAAIVAGVTSGLRNEVANDKMAAAINLSPEEAERLGRISSDVYRGAWGDSLAEVNGVITQLHTNIGDTADMSDGMIRTLTTGALDIANVFEQDTNEVLRTAGQLIRTGLARDGKEALDILTYGFQTGANKSGDFLDTLNEYAEPFSSLGIEGPQAVGLINAALGAGAYNADKAGDALKEFSIRAIDGSAATKQAYRDIGLDADEMATKIAQGGPAAAQATSEIIRALGDMDDKVAQDMAGVALFGSTWEDLGPDVIAALDPMGAKIDEISGKTQAMSDKANDNAWTNAVAIWRTALGTFTDFVTAVFGPTIEAMVPKVQELSERIGEWLDENGPAIQKFVQEKLSQLSGWWEENGPAIRGFIGEVQTAATEMAVGFQDAWVTYIQPAYEDIRAAFADLSDSMGELRAAVMGDTASMGKSWQTVGAAIGFVVASILVALTFVINKASVVATQAATVTTAIKSAWQGVQDRFNGVRDALQGVYDKWINLKNIVSRGINWPSLPSWVPGIGGGGTPTRTRHSGGIVPGPSGATVPILAQAGEMVRSAAQVRQDRRNGGGGGMSITVNAYGTTGREMVAEIERAVRDGARAGWLSSAGVTP